MLLVLPPLCVGQAFAKAGEAGGIYSKPSLSRRPRLAAAEHRLLVVLGYCLCQPCDVAWRKSLAAGIPGYPLAVLHMAVGGTFHQAVVGEAEDLVRSCRILENVFKVVAETAFWKTDIHRNHEYVRTLWRGQHP